MTETLKPCPFCNDPMTAGKFADLIQHVTQTEGCPLRSVSLAIEQLANWNTRAPDDELAILRAEVTRLRQINAGNEAATVAKIVAWLRAHKAFALIGARFIADAIERLDWKDKD